MLERARIGDPAAERELYDKHVDRVYILALRMCGDEEFARICTQDTFVKVFQKLDQFRGEAALGTWIHSIAVTTVLGALRKRKRLWAREVELDAMVLDPVDPRKPPEEVGLAERIHAAIMALPDLYRLVVILHDLEGFDHNEVGARLQIAPSSSRSRLSRARAMLRKTLRPYIEAVE